MPEEVATGGVSGVPGRLLLLALAAQVALGAVRAGMLVAGLPGFSPPLLGRWREDGAFTSAGFALAVLAVAALAGVRSGGSVARRLEAAGLAGLLTMAGAGVALTVAGVATTRFVPAAAWGAVAVAALGAGRLPAGPAGGRGGAPTAWDAVTLLFLGVLLVPTVFPYVHFDAEAIWGCRALTLAGSGSLASLASCTHGAYPPLFSLLLGLGGRDPVLEGRLAAWLLAVLAALLLRGALDRLSPRLAAPATLFVVSTGWVWVSSAMYYANVPLMAFLSAGTVLVVGAVPRGRGEASPPLAGRLAATLLFAAAVLVRPDGLVYVGAVAAAVALVSLRGRAWPDPLPFAGAALGWLAWHLRPDALRVGTTFVEQAPRWREAGATEAEAVVRILGVTLHALQGLWLAHWGLGVAIWVLLGTAFVVARRGRTPSPATVAWGLTAAAGLGAVLAVYAALPFTVDVVAGVATEPGRGFLASWESFARVGIGRMVVHLLPAGAFFVLAAVEDVAPGA